jgi:hypothetical protein
MAGKKKKESEELKAFLEESFSYASEKLEESKKSRIRRPFLGVLNKSSDKRKDSVSGGGHVPDEYVQNEDVIHSPEPSGTPGGSAGKETSIPDNIENRVNNKENLIYKDTYNQENKVNNIETYDMEQVKTYDNNSEIYDIGQKITYQTYDNNSEIYVNGSPKRNLENESSTFVSDISGAADKKDSEFILDRMKLNESLKKLRSRKDIRFGRTDCSLIELLYKHGEILGQMTFEILLYRFAEQNGISNYTVCQFAKKMPSCGMFGFFVSTRRTGTYIQLDSSFFYTADRKIDRYKYLSSIEDRRSAYLLSIASLFVNYADMNRTAEKAIMAFSEKVRRTLAVSAKQELQACGAKLYAVLNILLADGNIKKPANYISAVLKKEGTNLLDRLTNNDMEKSRLAASLMERVYNGELDELSADELSLLLGRSVKRREGSEQLFARLSAVIENM